MKSLRKRAMAKTVRKRYKSGKNGGFTLYDTYGSVGFTYKISELRIINFIKS